MWGKTNKCDIQPSIQEDEELQSLTETDCVRFAIYDDAISQTILSGVKEDAYEMQHIPSTGEEKTFYLSEREVGNSETFFVLNETFKRIADELFCREPHTYICM